MKTNRKKLTLNLALALFLILMCSLLIFGCADGEQGENKAKAKTGLHIYSMSTGLGSVSNDNINEHRLRYSICLTNEDDGEAYINWIEPILGKGIKERVITEKLQIPVEKAITSKGNLEIEGVIILDTRGLAKKEIVALEPFITGIKVGSEKVIVINTQLHEG